MKKNIIFLWVVFAAMVLSSPVLADSRVDAMGTDPRVTDDQDIIWMYPNQVLNYKNTLDFRLNDSSGDFGGGTGEWGGVTKDLSDMGLGGGVLSVYINRPFAPTFGVYPIEYWIPTGATAFWGTTESFLYQAPDKPTNGVWAGGAVTMSAPTPTNKFDLIWAGSMGGFDLGVKLNYGDNQPNSPDNAVTTTANNGLSGKAVNKAQTDGIDIGLGMKSDFFSQINFHAGYASGSFQDLQSLSNGPTISNNGGKDDGIYTITAGTLLQHDVSADNNVRVFGDWNLNQFSAKDTVQTSLTGNYDDSASVDYTASTKYSLMVGTLGLGGNHKFADGKSLLTAGFLASYWNSKQTASENDKSSGQTVSGSYSSEEDITTWDVAFNTGIEAKVSGWLTLRAGIEKSLFDSSDTKVTLSNPSNPTTTIETTGDSSLNPNGVQYNMGFGIQAEDWVLNAVYSAKSFETSLGAVQPGNGIFFDNHSGTGTGPIVQVVQADITHPF
jgi:hypothetical protein